MRGGGEGRRTCVVLANGQLFKISTGSIVPGTQHVSVWIVDHVHAETLLIPRLEKKKENHVN